MCLPGRRSPKSLCPPKGRKQRRGRLSQAGSSGLGRERGALYTLHLPWPYTAKPQVAVSCHLQAGVGREWLSHKDFSLLPAPARAGSAGQCPPATSPTQPPSPS